jgi:2,4-dienoyl-CoA reductase-like NADH-dependent reductase (Old Yellow Enzyme family)
VAFAERIKRDSGLPTISVGLITEAQQAEDIIASKESDMVALARAILFDPRWPWRMTAQLGAQSARAAATGARSREYKHLFGDTTLGQR